MICPNCHSQIEEGSNFCPYCGYPIRRAEDSLQAPPVGPSSDPKENPASASDMASHQPQQPPMEPASLPQGPGAPMAGPGAPRLHRKLSAIEVWLIVIGIVALIALIISIVNAVHIETIKNALIEVIQNLQSGSN
ncbi:MAG: zinc-ribbon domain-containing protein [Aeriscardovia sp.]|nr:zinc-ribbon domain-containing protein [Aeriscardovia sp.]